MDQSMDCVMWLQEASKRLVHVTRLAPHHVQTELTRLLGWDCKQRSLALGRLPEGILGPMMG